MAEGDEMTSVAPVLITYLAVALHDDEILQCCQDKYEHRCNWCAG